MPGVTRHETAKPAAVAYTFQSFETFLAWIDKAELEPVGGYSGLQSHTTRDAGWAGTATWDEALAVARIGWPEGERRVQTLSDAVSSKVQESLTGTAWVRRVEGEEIDVAAFAQGQPDCWLQRTHDDTRRVVTIRACIGVSSGIPTEQLFHRGAAIVALVEALEMSGFGVRVEAVKASGFSSKDKTRRVSAEVVVKESSQPVDRDRLTFVLCHNASYRRLGFCFMENAPLSVRSKLGAYGTPMSFPVATDDGATIYLDKMLYGDAQWASVESAVAWVRHELVGQGIEIRD